MHLAIGLWRGFQINYGLMSPPRRVQGVWTDNVSHLLRYPSPDGGNTVSTQLAQ